MSSEAAGLAATARRTLTLPPRPITSQEPRRTLLPHAARQVVLLSTDEEIAGDHLRRLLPSVGARYLLDFDDAEACTSIQEGYLDA